MKAYDTLLNFFGILDKKSNLNGRQVIGEKQDKAVHCYRNNVLKLIELIES